jgi:hypothetical protein
MEKPIYQHLTEVINECSDTEPVMFILQENKLYLELETCSARNSCLVTIRNERENKWLVDVIKNSGILH